MFLRVKWNKLKRWKKLMKTVWCMPFYLNTLAEIFSNENLNSIDDAQSLKENELNKAAKRVHTDFYINKTQRRLKQPKKNNDADTSM